MNILVPTDFSEIADNALAYATIIAGKLNAKIILLHVIPPNTWWVFDSDLIAAARQKQEQIRKKLVAEGMDPAAIETHIISDFPLNKYINNFIFHHKIDLIIMGTRGKGLSAALLGSFTMGMIDNVPIPILVVPPHAKPDAIHHILYPTDLENVTDETRKIVPLARAFNASIHIVHIPDNSIGAEMLANTSLQGVDKLMEYKLITTEIAHGASIRQIIDQQLRLKQADLLVMFAHKKGFFEKLFQGSRTEQMSGHVEVPLLVYQKLISD